MLYRISNISFIGGSFVDKGGQNFVESIYSKCPISWPGHVQFSVFF